LLYDRQPEEAVRLWQKTVEIDPKMAIAYRNLAVAYARQDGGVPKAIEALEKAVALNGGDAIYLFELDRLYEFAQAPLEKRTALFASRLATAAKRDDAMSRVVTLENLNGQYDEAIAILEKRHFHLWEGGARFNVQDAWTDAHLLRGHRKMKAKDYAGALKDYQAAIQYPENIEVTRGYRGSRAPEVFYFAGLALETLGRGEEAKKAWRDSASELLGTEDNPRATVDSGAVLLYYQALSLTKLGETARAKALFQSLLDAAKRSLDRAEGQEFFAKFGERQSPRVRAANAHYVAGLGHLGLGQTDAAKMELSRAVEMNPYLLDARARLMEMRQ
jgi:tetratricopeptide (TPR) repeat protein